MPNPKLCAICGWAQATTNDHIPPRGVFPRPLPPSMITVPACVQCNNGSSVQDERFRVYLAMATSYYNTEATRLWKEQALRTLDSNQKLRREVMESIQLLQDTPKTRPGVPFLWPISAYKPTIERIVRGLYWHHFGVALGRRVACEIDMLDALPASFIDDSSDWETLGVGDGIFAYRFVRATENPLYSVWVLQFFESHWALVKTDSQVAVSVVSP